jgi:hypothetical protein
VPFFPDHGRWPGTPNKGRDLGTDMDPGVACFRSLPSSGERAVRVKDRAEPGRAAAP